MSGLAPVDVNRRISEEINQIQHIPSQDSQWRNGVVVQGQQLDPSYTIEQATPHAHQPIPDSKDLRKVNAERTGVEPSGIDISSPSNMIRLVTEDWRGSTGMDYRVVSGKGKHGVLAGARRLMQKLRRAA